MSDWIGQISALTLHPEGRPALEADQKQLLSVCIIEDLGDTLSTFIA